MTTFTRRAISQRMLAMSTVALASPVFGQANDEVTIGHTPSLVGYAARIAQELGIYEKHNLKAKLVLVDSANAATTALVSKSIDAAISGPGELIAGSSRGLKMVAIANVYGGLNAHVILSKTIADKIGISPEAPIEERLKALDGLIFGSVSPTSAFTVTMRTATEDVGAKLKFTFMAQPAMQAALESGAIQAFIASAPFWVFAPANNTGVVWISGPKAEFPSARMPSHSASVQIMREFADTRPGVANRIAGAFADLGKAFGERPNEVKASIGRMFPALSEDLIERFYGLEARGFMAKPLTVADMAHEIAYVKASGANLPGIDTIEPRSLLFP